MTQPLTDAITEMREEDALKLTNQLLDNGASPADILTACKDAMDAVALAKDWAEEVTHVH